LGKTKNFCKSCQPSGRFSFYSVELGLGTVSLDDCLGRVAEFRLGMKSSAECSTGYRSDHKSEDG
jgi:hypothetical protein